MIQPEIDLNTLYRLPWTLPDNGISWLEPTASCNLHCHGCYRKNIKDSHKSFEEVKHELDVFQALRKSDCISIAGGDPLLYPDIIKLVAEIKSRGLKPIINTNGIALTPDLLIELKKAGVFGFTFHVDSKQGRKGEWEGKNEVELNELRYYYARMVADVKDIACSFNSTVYDDTLQYTNALVEWAQKNIDIVHTMVFILYRYVDLSVPFNCYAGEKKIEFEEISYQSETDKNATITSPDLVRKIQEKHPDFKPSAYLNGTDRPDLYKWLLTERIGNKKIIFGYVGKKFVELIMSVYHFTQDRYISYASPRMSRMGKLTFLFLWPFDQGLRRAFGKYLLFILANPFRLLKRVHMQTIMIIQPIDVGKDGHQSMCDGCPDITVHKDQLVWSCRLEEKLKYGDFIRSYPKETETNETSI